MNKVIIEITEEGWKTTLELNGQTYFDEHKATSTGSTQVAGGFDELDDEENYDLIESLTGFAQYDIMNALSKLV